MKGLSSVWTRSGLMVAVTTCAIAGWLGASFEVLMVSLVGGVGAVLLTAFSGTPTLARLERARAPENSKSNDIGVILNALSDPVLLVVTGKVEMINTAAARLLGTHILGEDIRTAIRHPAATDYLSLPNLSSHHSGIALAGLGTRDQRWLMRVADLSDGRRLVHLTDHSLAYTAERVRVDFVANASHELRTPLAAILGFIETLDDPEAGSDAATRTRFLTIMMKEARRMQALVDDLISLSRIEADKHRAPAHALQLEGLVADVARIISDQPASAGRPITITLADDAALPAVAGDQAQLSQLLHNLIGNAVKYGRPGSPIELSLKRQGASMVRLSVCDEGDGIAEDHLPRLTERFYRVDSGRSRAMGGTGLGLSIVKHIVERHRGRLAIESVVGQGTKVSVDLPLAQ